MRGAILGLWALAAGPAVATEVSAPAPSDHTVVYYNARMALREGQPVEVVKLWLLRNALAERDGGVSPHDADFHTLTWAALGQLGVCQDGLPPDGDGAGLWSLALYNWVVAQMSRRPPPPRPRPFKAFEAGQQHRFISLHDVLGYQELRTVSLSPGFCARPRLMLVGLGEDPRGKLSEPEVAARLLLRLLDIARSTVREDVEGWAVIDARRFDLHLQLMELAERKARREALERSRKGREVGLSTTSLAILREDAPALALDPASEPARILGDCVDWPASEWMALAPERRRFLFDQARAYGADPERLDQVALRVIDQLIERGDGDEVTRWIGRLRGEGTAERIWGGERGERLLALDVDSGFRERAVIALHRGVRLLEEGDLHGALRAMAFALRHAHESRDGDAVRALSLRWLSYVASRFQSTDELLTTLQQLVNTRDYSLLLEDLMWSAAFHADERSFQAGLRNQKGRGALERRLELLRPLAAGQIGGFTSGLRARLQSSPSEVLRFLQQLVARLELEDGEVRLAHRPTLLQLRELLTPLLSDDQARQQRSADALLGRIQAILEGQGGIEGTTDRERARALSPQGEVFAGSIRLAPVDPLPWPFLAADTRAPSAFSRIELQPVEWRRPDDELVFGWRIGG